MKIYLHPRGPPKRLKDCRVSVHSRVVRLTKNEKVVLTLLGATPSVYD